MYIKSNKNHLVFARKLRKNMTKYEKHLWYDFLSEYPIRFQRQKPIGEYIVDFYCHKAKLIIELDGSQHYFEEAIRYEQKRKQYFKDKGIFELRFTNLDIAKNFKGVCEQIDMVVKDRIGDGGGNNE